MSSIEITPTGSIRLNADLRKNLYCFKSTSLEGSKKYHLIVPEMANFSEQELFFTEVPSVKKISQNVNAFREEGNSQMSLLLAEIYFICKCIPPTEDKVLIIYIGAHPGDHINYLISMFNNVNKKKRTIQFEFHLYDSINTEESMKKIGKDPYTDEEFDGSVLKKFNILFTNTVAKNYIKNGIYYQPERNIYLISDIRNVKYNSRESSAEINSKILDNDTLFQLEWCQIIKPKYAFLKFRPKLPEEMITFSNQLTDERDNDEARKLYFKYPNGVFIKLPFQKKTQKAVYFICKEYEPIKKYYHYDMMSILDYHHNHIRKNVIYENPFTSEYGMNTGLFGLDVIESIMEDEFFLNILERNDVKLNDIKKISYVFGCGWDHRSALFISVLYLRYLGHTIPNFSIPDILKKDLAKKVVYPLILMREISIKSEI